MDDNTRDKIAIFVLVIFIIVSIVLNSIILSYLGTPFKSPPARIEPSEWKRKVIIITSWIQICIGIISIIASIILALKGRKYHERAGFLLTLGIALIVINGAILDYLGASTSVKDIDPLDSNRRIIVGMSSLILFLNVILVIVIGVMQFFTNANYV